MVILVIIIATTIVDTSIVGIVTSSGGISASKWDLGFFIYTVILFAIGQYIIQRFFRKEYFPNGRKIVNVKLYPIIRLVSITMYVLVIILVFICIEALFAKSYHLIALKLAISISYGTSLIVLSVLVWNLFSWLRINRSLNVLLYLIAISVISLNAAITIMYLLTEYSDNPDIVRPQRSLTGAYSTLNVRIGTAYVLTSVISFVLMWLATAVLLRNYSSRLAKIKFWILIVLPLAYFLGQFQPLFLYTFTDFRMTNPVTFGIIYNIVINASKPLGALLFGIAFWQTSKLINNDSVKKYLILSGVRYDFIIHFKSTIRTNFCTLSSVWISNNLLHELGRLSHFAGYLFISNISS